MNYIEIEMRIECNIGLMKTHFFMQIVGFQ